MNKGNTKQTRPRYRLVIPDEAIPTDLCLLRQYLQADEGPNHPEYYLLKMHGWEAHTPEAVTELVCHDPMRSSYTRFQSSSFRVGCNLRMQLQAKNCPCLE